MKLLMTFFFLLMAREIWACSINTNKVDELFSNPNEAKTVFFGIMTGSEDNRKLAPVKPWKGGTVQFSGKEVSYCIRYTAFGLNQKYFFISNHTTEEFNKGAVKAHMTNSGLVGISSLGSYIGQLTTPDEFPKGVSNIFWSYCRYDHDCMYTKNACGKNVGVSRDYKTRYDNYIKNKQCSKKPVIDNRDVNSSKCVENFCS